VRIGWTVLGERLRPGSGSRQRRNTNARVSIRRDLRVEHAGERDSDASGDHLAYAPDGFSPIARHDGAMLDHAIEDDKVRRHQRVEA
jgi:hypothetical protein